MTQTSHNLTEYPWPEAPATGKRANTGVSAPPPTIPQTSITECITTCTDGKVFHVGGFDMRTQRPVAGACMWDSNSEEWRKLPDAPVRLSHGSAVVTEDGTMLLFGGWDGTQCSAELWTLCPILEEETVSDAGAAAPASQKGRPPAAAPSAIAAPTAKSGEVVQYCWHRLDSDALVSPSPSARRGHALVAGHAVPSAADSRRPGLAAPQGGVMEPVLYLFGGNDGTTRLNDVWRLWLTPTLGRRVAHWEKLEATGGVIPCAREDALIAFDAARQSLWVYGGRTATGVLDDMWTLSLPQSTTATHPTWTSVYPVGSRTSAPARNYLSAPGSGGVAVVEGDTLYLCFCGSLTQTFGSKIASTSDNKVPVYGFCIPQSQWQPVTLTSSEEPARATTSTQTAAPSRPRHAPRFFTVCASGRFLYWIRDGSENNNAATGSDAASGKPAVVSVELNAPPTKPTKRRTERNR